MKNLVLPAYTRLVNFFYNRLFTIIKPPPSLKAKQELRYWKTRKAIEGKLSNSNYEYFFTTQFGLEKSFYRGKKILDIGCGPRGSLEWAEDARLCVGLDPLAHRYSELGTSEHRMKYVAAFSEDMPFPDGYFDIVSSFNSLNHTNDLGLTIKEIKRVMAPGGLFLLITDVNDRPRICEPITYSWDITGRFGPELEVVEEKHYSRPFPGIYDSIKADIPYDHNDKGGPRGVLAAKFVKRA